MSYLKWRLCFFKCSFQFRFHCEKVIYFCDHVVGLVFKFRFPVSDVAHSFSDVLTALLLHVIRHPVSVVNEPDRVASDLLGTVPPALGRFKVGERCVMPVLRAVLGEKSRPIARPHRRNLIKGRRDGSHKLAQCWMIHGHFVVTARFPRQTKRVGQSVRRRPALVARCHGAYSWQELVIKWFGSGVGGHQGRTSTRFHSGRTARR